MTQRLTFPKVKKVILSETDNYTYILIPITELENNLISNTTDRDFNFKIGGYSFKGNAILAYGESNPVVDELIKGTNLDPLDTLDNLIKRHIGRQETVERAVPDGYDKVTNTAPVKEGLKTFGIILTNDPIKIINYNIGLIGNPKYCAILKLSNYMFNKRVKAWNRDQVVTMLEIDEEED